MLIFVGRTLDELFECEFVTHVRQNVGYALVDPHGKSYELTSCERIQIRHFCDCYVEEYETYLREVHEHTIKEKNLFVKHKRLLLVRLLIQEDIPLDVLPFFKLDDIIDEPFEPFEYMERSSHAESHEMYMLDLIYTKDNVLQ
jgi:hypothetical protein